MSFTIREAGLSDLADLLSLYSFLHAEDAPSPEAAGSAWAAIQADPNHHLLLGVEEGFAAAACALVVVPNLTRAARPYALIENVVTHPDFRGRGLATALLRRAAELARESGCYKVMLLTGHRDDATLNFYRGAGFNSEDKTAFIQWL